MWSSGLLGSPIPRFGTARTDGRPSHGGQVAAVAEALGLPLMPWQRHVADVALEHEDGKLCFRDVVIGTPRQSGKSSLMLPLIVYRLLSAPDLRVVYGAQSRLAARLMMLDGAVAEDPPVAVGVHVHVEQSDRSRGAAGPKRVGDVAVVDPTGRRPRAVHHAVCRRRGLEPRARGRAIDEADDGGGTVTASSGWRPRPV